MNPSGFVTGRMHGLDDFLERNRDLFDRPAPGHKDA